MTAISTHRRRILLLSVLFWLAGPVRAQSAVSSNGQGSVTIDASRMNGVVSIDAPWRFHAGDDARFADPNLDDSAWPLVQPGVARPLAESHIEYVPDGKDWMRLHLHILNANAPLAISLTARNATPYGVYADGRQIGASTGFGEAHPIGSRPSVIALPQTKDIVLAIHFVTQRGLSVHFVPLERLEIGQREAVGDRIDLGRYRRFEENSLVDLALGMIYLACVPFSLALWLSQRNHTEYFWLTALFSVYGFAQLSVNSRYVLWFYGPVLVIASYFLGAAQGILLIEFVLVITGGRLRWLVRSFQAELLVLAMLDAFAPSNVAAIGEGVSAVLELILTGYLLLTAYFRGNKECGLLFFPMALFLLSDGKTNVEDFSPMLLGPLWTGHLGGVGFTVNDIAQLLILAALLAVVFYRFIRVSRDEEIAAAELQAARTVQRLLIPETAPGTPGFSVESVYLPARQVGGDFFLVLPALEGSGDQSLLAIMGDVSGKGLQAAMVVSTIIGGLRMQLSRQPGEVLAHLNRMLSGHVSGFVTCCAVLIEPDGRMRIANAGNPAPYLDGEEIAILPGLPLGLASEMRYEETTGVLEHGRQLTFVSDGVIEATSVRKDLFGFERTREISGTSASAIAEAATVFGAGAPQADDITVLTVARA